MASGAIKYRPFKFERSFDTESATTMRRKQHEEEERKRLEEEALKEELPPPPPTFSEEELEAAKAAAYQEGHAAGHALAKQEQESHIIAALHTITGQLAVLHDRQALANEVTAAELARITGAIIGKILPDFTRRHGAEEIIALVKTCLEPLEDTGRVTIRVSTELKDTLEERMALAQAESGFQGQVLLLGDPALGPADVKIDWGQGGADRNADATWQAIEEAIAQATGQAQAQLEDNRPETAPMAESLNEVRTVTEEEQLRPDEE